MAIADSSDAAFAPAIGSGAGLVMRKRFPRGATRAVVFADSAPLAFGEIWAPALPIFLPGAIVFEANIFSGLQSGHRYDPRPKNLSIFASSAAIDDRNRGNCTLSQEYAGPF